MTEDPNRPDLKQMLVTGDSAERATSDGVMTEKAIVARELVFGRWVIDPDVSLGAHVHSADTIAYCVRGGCSFEVGDDLEKEFRIGPGDYAFIPAETVHTETTGSEGVELIFARDLKGGVTRKVDVGR